MVTTVVETVLVNDSVTLSNLSCFEVKTKSVGLLLILFDWVMLRSTKLFKTVSALIAELTSSAKSIELETVTETKLELMYNLKLTSPSP